MAKCSKSNFLLYGDHVHRVNSCGSVMFAYSSVSELKRYPLASSGGQQAEITDAISQQTFTFNFPKCSFSKRNIIQFIFFGPISCVAYCPWNQDQENDDNADPAFVRYSLTLVAS